MIYDTYGQCITLVVGNPKGGVGKSTVANTLAAGFAMRGYRVLLVDTDTQGHAARLLGMPKRAALYELLTGRTDPLDAVDLVDPARYLPPDWEGAGELMLVASNRETQLIPLEVNDVFVLRTAISHLADLHGIDLCVVDTAPTATLLESAIFYAADTMLLVSEATALAADGLAEGIQALAAVNANRADDGMVQVKVLGVLINKLMGSPKVQRKWLNRLKAREHLMPGPLYEACLPQRTVWQQAAERGQSIFSFAPLAGDTDDAAKVVDETHTRIMQWLTVETATS